MPGQDALEARPRLLPPREVRAILGLGRTTVHDWTVAGRLVAVTSQTGYRRYPEDQPVLREALAARQAAS
jgi:predicted site-specific integrase-resolvase